MTARAVPAAGSAGAAAAAALAALAGARMPDDVPVAGTALGAAGLVWLAVLLRSGRLRPVRSTLLVPALVFSTACLASALVAPRPDRFTIALALAPAGAGILSGVLTTPRARRHLVDALLVVLAVVGLMALQRYRSGEVTGVGILEDGRLTRRIFPAAFGHPNQFAAALVLMMPFAVARLLGAAGRRRLVAAVPLGLGAAALFLTYSRGFWLGFALSCLVVVTSRRQRLALLGAGALVLAALGPRIADRFTAGDTLENSRLGIWRSALRVIADHPLLGVGVNDFAETPGVALLPQTADAAPHAHNLALIAATEIGIPGALAMLAGLVALIVPLVRSAPPAGSEDALTRRATLAALTAGLIGGLFDGVVFHNVQTLLVAMAVLGLTAALTRWPAPHAPGAPVDPRPGGRGEPAPPVAPAASPGEVPVPAGVAAGDALRPVARNFTLLVSSTLATRLLTFALGLVLARHLGVGDYGVYTLASAVVLVGAAVTDLGLEPFIVREVARDRRALDRALPRLVGARLAVTGTAAVGLVGWVVVDRGDAVARAVALVFAATAFDNLALLGYAYLQGLERMGAQAAGVLSMQVLRTAGGVALAVSTGDLDLVLAWMAVTGAVGLGIALVALRRVLPGRRRGGRGRVPPLPTLLASSGAMMLVVLFNAVILRADSIVIGAVDGAGDVGLYTAAYALVTAVQILPWITSVAVYPLFARAFGTDPRLLGEGWRNGLRATLLVGLPAAVLASVLGPQIVVFVYGDAFRPSGYVLSVLMWWIPLAGVAALGTALLRSADRERTNALIVGVGAAANVAANIVVVPLAGFRGAAWVTVLAELGMVAATLWVVRGVRLGIPLAELARAVPALAAGGAVAFALRDVNVVGALVAGVAVYALLVVALRAVTPDELRRLRVALAPARG